MRVACLIVSCILTCHVYAKKTPKTTTTTTTTIKPVPGAQLYEVYGDKHITCLRVEAAIKLVVNFSTNDNETDVKTFDFSKKNFAKHVAVHGSCGSTDSTLVLSFPSSVKGESEDNNTLTLHFKSNGKVASLSEISFKYDLNSTYFKHALPLGWRVADNKSLSLDLGPAGKYYECMVSKKYKVDTAVSFSLGNFRAQPFGLNNGSYTNKGKDCMSPLPVPTSKPPTPPKQICPLKKPFGNECILMNACIQFKVEYKNSKGKNKSVTIAVPNDDLNITGVCNENDETLVISHKPHGKYWDEFDITFTFSPIPNKNDTYALVKLQLGFRLDRQHFPDIEPRKKDNKTVMWVGHAENNSGLAGLHWSKGHYYSCKTVGNVDLKPGKVPMIDVKGDVHSVTLLMQQVEIEAFRAHNASKGKFVGKEERCEKDKENTNIVVPIAVGSALGALVVIVLVAYCIGRKKARQQYEQI